MLPIENVPLVLALGILAFNKVGSFARRNLSDWAVQMRRASLLISDRPIHDYVPLYFATHTPMQYRLTESARRTIEQKELVFIELDATRVFQIPGVLFADGNAAAEDTRFYHDLSCLKRLDWHVIHHVRRCQTREYRRRKMAEVLVPEKVPSTCFNRLVVFSGESQLTIKRLVESHVDELTGLANDGGRYLSTFYY
jgi:hypothetical protein